MPVSDTAHAQTRAHTKTASCTAASAQHHKLWRRAVVPAAGMRSKLQPRDPRSAPAPGGALVCSPCPGTLTWLMTTGRSNESISRLVSRFTGSCREQSNFAQPSE